MPNLLDDVQPTSRALIQGTCVHLVVEVKCPRCYTQLEPADWVVLRQIHMHSKLSIRDLTLKGELFMCDTMQVNKISDYNTVGVQLCGQ